MYEQFFSMEHTPFVRDIPTERLYLSPKIEDAVGRLKYATDHKLFSVVMSEPGCGKSTLARLFASRLSKTYTRYAQEGSVMKHRVNVSITPDMAERLKVYAWENHKTVSQAITD